MSDEIDGFDFFDFAVIDLLEMWCGYASTTTRVDMSGAIEVKSAYSAPIP
jgi:hypothetical protein